FTNVVDGADARQRQVHRFGRLQYELFVQHHDERVWRCDELQRLVLGRDHWKRHRYRTSIRRSRKHRGRHRERRSEPIHLTINTECTSARIDRLHGQWGQWHWLHVELHHECFRRNDWRALRTVHGGRRPQRRRPDQAHRLPRECREGPCL